MCAVVPSMGVALLSHYVDLHDWEVSTLLFLFWMLSLIVLFAAGVYVLGKIRENIAANRRERASGKRKKTDMIRTKDKAAVGIMVEQREQFANGAVGVMDGQVCWLQGVDVLSLKRQLETCRLAGFGTVKSPGLFAHRFSIFGVFVAVVRDEADSIRPEDLPGRITLPFVTQGVHQSVVPRAGN